MNYTISVNFASKDNLISGNPLKLIKGADFTTEFTNVAAAIASKLDGTLVFAPDGTAVQPSYGFTNNAGTGMYNAAGVLGFSTGGASRATIGAAGNVSINAPTSGVGFRAIGIGSSSSQAFIAQASVGTAPASVDAGEIMNITNTSTTGDNRLISFGQVGANAYIRPVQQGAGPTAAGLVIFTQSGGTTFASAGNVTISAPASGIAFSVTGFAGSSAIVANSASTADVVMSLGNITGGQVVTSYSINGAVQGFTGFTGTAGQLSADSAAGDFVARTTSKAFRVSTNNGTSSAFVVDSAGLTNVSNGTGISPVYAGVPQTSVAGNYTLVLGDANKHIRQTVAATITIPSNASVPFPIGTAITFCNRVAGNTTIAITSDSLTWSANNSAGSRTLGTNAMATAIKTDATIWLISGAGLT